MAAPNIVNTATLIGRTAVAAVTTVASDIVTNSAASNKVFKINSIMIANIDGTVGADITVSVFRSSVEYKLAHQITVPAKTTLVVSSKDTQIYLEEGDTIRVTASANSRLHAIVSYEDIS